MLTAEIGLTRTIVYGFTSVYATFFLLSIQSLIHTNATDACHTSILD